MGDNSVSHSLRFLKLNKKPDQDMVKLTRKFGHDILTDPQLNKVLATMPILASKDADREHEIQ